MLICIFLHIKCNKGRYNENKRLESFLNLSFEFLNESWKLPVGGRSILFSISSFNGQLFLKTLQGRKDVTKKKKILPRIHFVSGVDVFQLWQIPDVDPFLIGRFRVFLAASSWPVAKLQFARLQAHLLWRSPLIITSTPSPQGPRFLRLAPLCCSCRVSWENFSQDDAAQLSREAYLWPVENSQNFFLAQVRQVL